MNAEMLLISAESDVEGTTEFKRQLQTVLEGKQRVLFIYTDSVDEKVREVLEKMVMGFADSAIEADAICVMGDDSHVLLDRLQSAGIMELIRKQVGDAVPYIGINGGAVVAGYELLLRQKRKSALALVPANIVTSYALNKTIPEELLYFSPVVGLPRGSALTTKMGNNRFVVEGNSTAAVLNINLSSRMNRPANSNRINTLTRRPNTAMNFPVDTSAIGEPADFRELKRLEALSNAREKVPKIQGSLTTRIVHAARARLRLRGAAALKQDQLRNRHLEELYDHFSSGNSVRGYGEGCNALLGHYLDSLGRTVKA